MTKSGQLAQMLFGMSIQNIFEANSKTYPSNSAYASDWEPADKDYVIWYLVTKIHEIGTCCYLLWRK